MKRFFACATVVLLTTSLSACGGDDQKESTPAAPATPATSATPSTPAAPATSATSSSGTSKAYTMAEVKKHADEQSCWTVIDGKVYDVTAWIGQHPGGPDRIKGLCGNDGSGAFHGQHANDTEPPQRLASFQIGTLAG